MTQETYGWLARNVLAGFTETRTPWWLQLAINEGHTPRTWDGPVPLEEVEQLLCSWNPEPDKLLAESDVLAIVERYQRYPDLIQQHLSEALVYSHKLIRASDDRSHLGLVGTDAVSHTYRDWLYGTMVECVRPDELEVSSAGLLRNRAQAWIQIERPQSAYGPGGVEFSPSITASTSLDGSAASMLNQNWTHTICDNTMRVTRGEGVSFRHTSGSLSKLGTFRGVMNAILKGETDFKAVLERLLADEVSERRFSKFLESFVPIDDDDKPVKRSRSERKRQEITQLYRNDPRVAAWRGTAFGVVQAVNTWNEHLSQLCNRTGIELSDTDLRAMRNFASRLSPVKRGAETEDEKTIRILAGV